MKKFLKNNDKWLYFILTFLISWPIWIAGKVLLPENLAMISLILGAFGPFIAAVIILRITEGASGLKEWFKINFNFRIKIIWYLLGGIILPFLIAGVHHLIYLGFGGKSCIELSPDLALLQVAKKYHSCHAASCRDKRCFQVFPYGNKGF